MRPSHPPRAASLAVVLFTLVLAACEGGGVDPVANPLAGLQARSAQDSTGTAPPSPPGGPSGTGYVHGTVLGPSAPGAGNDSLSTAPRVANTIVNAYAVLGGTMGDPTLGPLAAADTTGADGRFILPPLAAGAYVVTFTPPSGSIYGGVWVTGEIHSTSHDWPWWVTLWRR